jgi:hypothetical protein
MITQITNTLQNSNYFQNWDSWITLANLFGFSFSRRQLDSYIYFKTQPHTGM